jgi:tRNA(Glu) U13 pseudouridine synthase TruD
LVFVEELQQQTGEDELHRNRRKMTLTLKLPRGSYATIVIKRLLL